jgi:hypothetical protein
VPRNGTAGDGVTANRVSGANVVRNLVVFAFIFPFRVLTPSGGVGSTKNPRLTGNRGFLEIVVCSRLKLLSHVAKMPRPTMPAGHLSAGQRDALLDIQRRFHFNCVHSTPDWPPCQTSRHCN